MQPKRWGIRIRYLVIFILLMTMIALSTPQSFIVSISSNRVLAAVESPSPDSAVLEQFDELESFVSSLANNVLNAGNRTSLIMKLNNAEAAYMREQPCTAVNILGAYLNETAALRNGEGIQIAEDLSNRGWILRSNLLRNLPSGFTCNGFEDVCAPPEIQILNSDNQRFTARVSFGAPLFGSAVGGDELWTQVEIPSLQSQFGSPGMPAVPTWYTLLAIPNGAEVNIVSSLPVISQTLFMNLYPFQEQAFDQEPPEIDSEFVDPPFFKDEKEYATDAFYPAEPCSITPLGQIRDLQVVQICCPAGQYNPVSDELRLFDSVEFDLDFEGGSGNFITSQSLSPFEPASASASKSVINRDVLPQYMEEVDINELEYTGEELLLLTHPDFRAAADDLAVWKEAKGIVTTVIEVGSGTYYDTGDKIDDLIEGRYDNCKIRPSYVLLLGDAEWIPPSRTNYNTSPDDTTGSDYDYAIYPQGYIDILPDFAVGRISVDTNDEAQVVVNKIIQYESNPPKTDTGDPFYTTTSNASQFQCGRMNADGTPLYGQSGTDQRAFIETSELVRDELISLGYTVERIYTETVDSGGYCLDKSNPCNAVQQAYSGNTTPNRYYNGTLLPADLRSGSGFAWNGTTADVIDAFNDGRFLILHRDHGASSGFGHPRFRISDLSSLTNGDLLPVVYSVNCASGYFDHETDVPGSNAECFMEELLRLDGGGMVGGLGDVRNSPTWPNNALTRGFYDATWPGLIPDYGDYQSIRRLGDILNYGKLYLLTQTNVTQTAGSIPIGNTVDELIIWHCYGDPTLEMWTSNPNGIILNKEFAAALLQDSLKVEYPIDGAVITAFQNTQEGTVPVGRATVENGVATLPFFQEPVGGVSINLSVSYENAVSVLLTSQTGQPDLTLEITAPAIASLGEDIGDQIGVIVFNTGDAIASGTVDDQGNVKNSGYMIDIVLSTDEEVPPGFALPQPAGAFVEDGLLYGGRISRTPDVGPDSSVVLSTTPPISSDIGGMIPYNIEPGVYFLCARIDPGDAVAESDENNNVYCVEILIIAD